ncbi:PadR family transcriptional regulator [Nocardioides sp. JQ2195]|uniref:PadR family transcriptional regulator n=1 Tax=Nocardioides sp. JQ2195 TaxID=2592334 RepID=UPI00143E875E|nr:PadR family transcriptional regulator [Nocardioides sp. JQ2195]QIX26552.1 PadR family transcriptional regulator [Nocardioides sp. JQ2195]
MAVTNDDEDLPNLRTTSWAVLGLLSFGSELSGYDLKKWADWSLRFFYWAPSFSQIYSELRKLEELGYATSRVVSKDDVRGKRLYSITATGTRTMARWVAESPVEPVVLKHGVMLRMWLGHLGDPASLREALAEHRELSEKMRVRAAADAVGAAAEPGWAFPELVLRWSEQYYASERDRTDSMLADLDALLARPRRSRRRESSPTPLSPDQLRQHDD